MTKPTNKEFYDLLSTLASEQTFSVQLTDGNSYEFKQLNTNQLKELVKTVVDSPLTQTLFNNAIAKIMKDSCVTEGAKVDSLNVVDRLLYVLETRINSLSETITLNTEDMTYVVDLKEVVKNLYASITNSQEALNGAVVTDGKLTITCRVPTIDTENKLNKEMYKNVKTEVENVEELRTILGDAFINEITKTVKSVSIGEQEIELDSMDFKSRLELVETLPASLIKQVILFVEKYKAITEKALEITENTSLPVDGSLFSLR